MNRTINTLCLLTLGVFILALSGCKTSNLAQCPDLTSAKKSHPVVASNWHMEHHNKSAKTAEQPVTASKPAANNNSSAMMATSAPSLPFKLQMPSSFTQTIEDDKQLDDMNKLLAQYSNNKVALQRNDKGKLFLRAHSIKDIFALAKNTSHPRGYYEKRYGNGGGGANDAAAGAAIASAVLGPISFVLAFIPFVCLAAIPISIVAIITGGVGLKSFRKRAAVAGLTFGILGLILSILFSWLYISFWFIFLL